MISYANENRDEVKELIKKGKARRKRQRVIFIVSMLIIPVIQFLIFYVYININSFPLAFQKKNVYFNKVEWVGWQNFEKVFREIRNNNETGILGRAIFNSILYFVFSTFLMTPLTIFFAFFFWKKMPGYRIFRFTFLLPSLMPGVVLPMLFSFMLDSTTGVLTPLLRDLGLGHLIPVNGWLGTYETAQTMIILYMFWSGCGTSIMLMSGNINRLPVEIFESARLDGIKLFQELWYLVIPMILPLFSIMIVSGVNTVLGIYLPPMLLTKGGPGGSTKTIAYIIMDWTTQGEEGVAAAAGLLFSAIAIPMVFGLKAFLEKITPEVQY